MLELSLAALLAGAVGSPHCLGMCGGFSAACSDTRGGVAAWSLGRLMTYAGLGAAAGAVGSVASAAVPGLGWAVNALALVLLLVFALRLGGWSPRPSGGRLKGLLFGGVSTRAARLLRRTGLPARFGFGALTGLLPCGLLYTALALPVASGDPLTGAVVMAAFWLGTVPALSVASAALRRVAAARPWTRRAVAAGVFSLGVVALITRAPVAPDEAPSCHTPDHSQGS